MTPLESGLWYRVLGFCLAYGGYVFSFAARFANDNGWRLLHALLFLDQCRKFAFLLAAAGHLVFPSTVVLQTWHLHVLSKSAWVAFRAGTPGMHAQHEPTFGFSAYPATSLRVSGNDGVKVAGTVRDGHFRVQDHSANF